MPVDLPIGQICEDLEYVVPIYLYRLVRQVDPGPWAAFPGDSLNHLPSLTSAGWMGEEGGAMGCLGLATLGES